MHDEALPFCSYFSAEAVYGAANDDATPIIFDIYIDGHFTAASFRRKQLPLYPPPKHKRLYADFRLGF